MNKVNFILVVMAAVSVCQCQRRFRFRPAFSFPDTNYIDYPIKPVDNSWRDDVDEAPGFQDGFNSIDDNRMESESDRNDADNGEQWRRTTVQPSTTRGTIHVSPENCPCQSTPQFNPVCGTDGNTYRNMGLLNCFKRCGINVAQRRMGTC